MVEAAVKNGKGRRGGRWALGLLLLVVLLLASAWIWRIALAERAAAFLHPSAGLGAVDFRIDRLDLDGARISDVAFPGYGVTAGTVDVSYDIGELFGGRVGTVRIEGLSARAEVGPDGVTIPGMAQGSGEGGISLPPIPADRVVLDRFQLALDTPQGRVAATGDAVLSAAGKGLRLVLLATLASEEGRVRAFADIDALRDAPDLAAGDSFRVKGDWSVGGDWMAVAGRAGGTIEAAVADGAIESLAADLTIADAAAAGVSAIGGTASIRYTPDAVVADADLRIPAGWLQLRVRPADGGRTDLRMAAQVDAGWLAALAPAVPRMSGTLGLSARGSAPLDGEGLFERTALTGTASLDLARIEVPDTVSIATLSGRMRIGYADGRLSVTAEPDLRAAGVEIGATAGATAGVPAALQPLLAGPLVVEGASEAPLRAVAAILPVGPAAIDLDLRVAGPAISGTITGAAAVIPSGDRVAIYTPAVALRLDRAATGAGTVSGVVRIADLLARPDAVRGTLAADLAVDRSVAAGMSAASGTLALAGDLKVADGIVTFDPAAPMTLAARGIDLGAARLPGETRLRLTADPLRYDTVSGDVGGAFTLAATDLSATGTPAGPISGRLAGGNVAMADGTLNADLSGALSLPDAGITLAGIRLSLKGGDTTTARVTVDRIEAAGAPPPVIPLKLAGEATLRGDRLAFDAELFDPGRRLVVSGKGSHRLDTGAGDASFAMTPITFLPTVLQPSNLFPVLAGRFSEVDGTIDGKGFFRWSRTGMRSGGSVSVAARTLAVSGAELHGVATEVRFDSLVPPQSAPNQIATVERVEVGLPFSDGRVVFSVEDGQRLRGRLENLSLFGGTIRTEPFMYDIASPDLTVTLRVDGVDLQSFLSFVDYGDVQAKGSLRGRLPVVIRNGRASIRDGVLETEAPGTLSYVPAGAEALGQANAGTEMLFNALRDFRYEQIRIEIDETPEQPMVLRLKLKGASPNVYDGFPLELNVNIGGALRDVLERGLKTYQLPAGVADRLGGTTN